MTEQEAKAPRLKKDGTPRKKPGRKCDEEEYLQPHEEQFVAMLAQGYTAIESYREAVNGTFSYATTSARANELKNRPRVKERLKELKRVSAEQNQVSTTRTVREIARIAFADPRRLFRDDGTPLDIQDLDDDTAASVVGIDVAVAGEGDARILKYRLASKNQALDKLMRHLGGYEKDNEQAAGGLADALMRARQRVGEAPK